MAQGNLKGVGGGASGILSGAAAVATVVAAIIAILSQFGLIRSHDSPRVAVTPIPGAPPVGKAAVAPVVAATVPPVVAAPTAKPSLVARGAAPHVDERHPRAKAPPAEIASSVRPASPPQVALAEPTASHLGAEDRTFSGAANTPATIDNNQSESIAGAWRDQGMGVCHLISQTGNKFQVINYDPVTGEVISQGEGTVEGNHVAIDYPNSRRPVTVDLHISPNGQWLLGKVTRFDETRRTMWRYLGPACPKPG
jgi:hypothetical protein